MLRRVAPAIALFFLSPFIAEFLLGDFPLIDLFALLFLAPMYGGGAVLIREVVRRTGRGWPTIVLLALAYGVFEEGITTQSLFDPNYAGVHLLDRGYIPGLGIAVPWTLFVLSLHTIWSISTPIALVETGSKRPATPWLRTPGLIAAATLFVVGSIATFATSYAQDHYLASAPQLAVVGLVVIALVVVAFRLPRTPRPVSATRAPSAWIVFAATIVAGVVFVLGFELPTWLAVAALVLATGSMLLAVRVWSARTGWDASHRLALAAGATLTYAWNAFGQAPVVDSTGTIDVVSHIVFALVALGLLALVSRRLRRPVEVAPEYVAVG